MKSRGPAHSAIRGTNVKSQMLSFQIFTGLRAIRLFQINGAIGNERGSEGHHGNHGFLVPQIPTFFYPRALVRVASRPVAPRRFIVARYIRVCIRRVHTRYYQYDLVVRETYMSAYSSSARFL